MAFLEDLARIARAARHRRWLYVPYDQLHDGFGPLAQSAPEELGVVLVESDAHARRRPYHQQKLALLLANQRHFALEQAERGVAVRYVRTPGTHAEALGPLVGELGGLEVMEPAERELRGELEGLGLVLLPHEGWLTTTQAFEASGYRMDRFYRSVRKEAGILVEDGRPVGGKWSFDAENRKPWRGEPEAPVPPRFPVTAVKAEVGELVGDRYADHPGVLDLEALPASLADAEALWQWALAACLPRFGPFEDAMSTRSTGLFHTRVSSLLNIHRLLPRRVLDDVLSLDIDLPSKEGFVRQVLGWREFVRHVHRATDGFRTCEANALAADEPLPPVYWGDAPSGLACLDRVVDDVWREGYSHHITRLMVLSNIATLLGIDPRELTDWFWVAYTDAYDWVVEPNVLGMGTFAAGDLMTTKPYVSGAAYIDKMSDYCSSCRFDPRKNCPITRLYWSFLARNEERLSSNPRMRMPFASLAKRSAAERERDETTYVHVKTTLAAGDEVHPKEIGT